MIALVALAAAVAPAPAAIRFAPPVGKPIFYETEQTRIANGEPQRYRMVNRLVFARRPDGWRLEWTMTDVTAQARVDFETLFLAGMRPFLNVPIAVRVSPDGAPVDVLNEAEAWASVKTNLTAAAAELARRNGGDGTAAVRKTREYFDSFVALDGPSRRRRLMDGMSDVLPAPLPALRPGENRPWGNGTITARPAGYLIESATVLPDPSLPHLRDRTEIDMDVATGLIRASRTTKTLGDTMLAEEATRRLP